MRKKIESSIQMLAHVKEKLSFIQVGVNTTQSNHVKQATVNTSVVRLC